MATTNEPETNEPTEPESVAELSTTVSELPSETSIDTRETRAGSGTPDVPPTPTEPGVVHASEALQALRNGETLQNVQIKGRLHLTGTFEHPVRFVNVEVKNLSIERAEFAGEVVFQDCRVHRPIIQRKTVFQSGLAIRASDVAKLKFRDVKVHGKVECQNARFHGKTEVLKTRFFGPVNFWEARFHGWVDFIMCRFDDKADFRSLGAEEGFTFRHCQFAADALFRGATVNKKFEFNGSRFDGLLDLSKAKLHDFVYLEQIEQGEGNRLAFWNAVADRIQVRPEQIEGRMASEYDNDHTRAMCEYGLLKRNFESLHRHEEEDWAFYRFKVNERRSKPRSWWRPWSKFSQLFEWLVLDLGCRYGTSPFRTIGAAAVFIVAFSLVYMAGVSMLPMESGKIPCSGEPTALGNRIVIGLVTSVSAFTDGLGSLRETAKGWMNLFLVAESLLGTLIWGLFIVAFSRKVIR